MDLQGYTAIIVKDKSGIYNITCKELPDFSVQSKTSGNCMNMFNKHLSNYLTDSCAQSVTDTPIEIQLLMWKYDKKDNCHNVTDKFNEHFTQIFTGTHRPTGNKFIITRNVITPKRGNRVKDQKVIIDLKTGSYGFTRFSFTLYPNRLPEIVRDQLDSITQYKNMAEILLRQEIKPEDFIK